LLIVFFHPAGHEELPAFASAGIAIKQKNAAIEASAIALKRNGLSFFWSHDSDE